MATVEELQYEKTLVSDSRPPATGVKGFVIQFYPYVVLSCLGGPFHFPTAAYKLPKFLGSIPQLPSRSASHYYAPCNLVYNVCLRLCPSTLLPYLLRLGLGLLSLNLLKGYFAYR